MTSKSLRSTLLFALFWCTLALLNPGSSSAQPIVLTFPSISCDSTVCDSLVLNNPRTETADIIVLRMRDSLSYAIDPAVALPQSIPAGGHFAVPICFRPQRRGTISDSLLVVIRSSTGFDSVRARITGKGLGASLEARPNVLNFPKTNPGLKSTLKMVISNNGDLPFTLTSANLVIPSPFRLVTTLPITLQPNDSVEIEVAFEPTETGVYSSPVDLVFGCNTRLQLGLNGVTDLIGTGAVLRISKTGFNPANNEQIPCDSMRCTVVTLSNVGNAPLIVDDLKWADGSLGYTITSNVATPLIIPGNSQRDVDVCLTSKQRGVLRDTILITSNTRSSIAFGLLLDASRSMTLKMKCGQDSSPRIDQAIIQATNFIQRTLLYLPSVGIQDQLAITTFTSAGFGVNVQLDDIFPITFITNALRNAATATLTGITPTGGTPTGAGLKHMIDILKTSPLQNRVLVLLTDGEPDASDQAVNPVNQIANLARSNGIRIFTIGVGLTSNTGRNYLQALANGTNGQAYDASDGDCSTLQTAFEAITDIVSRGAKTREPFQMKVLSPLIVTTKDVKFDSVYVHGTTCHIITLTNAGEGDAVIDTVQFKDLLGAATNEFSIANGVRFPITIPESGQTDVVICFTPDKIRTRNGQAIFSYNSCGAEPVVAGLSGAAFATANLRVTDERIGLPGQTVTMPVYADTALGLYSVNTIRYKVRWNKSMLDLVGVRPSTSAPGTTAAITAPVTFDSHYATVEITSSGNGIQGGGELAQLDFQVLRGDSLGSTVELTYGLFEDDNPRAQLANAGMIAYDSTCFRNSKRIGSGPVAKVVAGEVTPTPARARQLSLPLTSDALTIVSIEVYSVNGTLAIPAREEQLIAGGNSVSIDMSGAAPGSYYAVVHTASGESLFRKILITR